MLRWAANSLVLAVAALMLGSLRAASRPPILAKTAFFIFAGFAFAAMIAHLAFRALWPRPPLPRAPRPAASRSPLLAARRPAASAAALRTPA